MGSFLLLVSLLSIAVGTWRLIGVVKMKGTQKGVQTETQKETQTETDREQAKGKWLWVIVTGVGIGLFFLLKIFADPR